MFPPTDVGSGNINYITQKFTFLCDIIVYYTFECTDKQIIGKIQRCKFIIDRESINLHVSGQMSIYKSHR